MTDIQDRLRELGWSEELINAFTVRAPFTAIEDQSYLPAPSVVDATSLIIGEDAILPTTSTVEVSGRQLSKK